MILIIFFTFTVCIKMSKINFNTKHFEFLFLKKSITKVNFKIDYCSHLGMGWEPLVWERFQI